LAIPTVRIVRGRRIRPWRIRLATAAWRVGDLFHALGQWLDGY